MIFHQKKVEYQNQRISVITRKNLPVLILPPSALLHDVILVHLQLLSVPLPVPTLLAASETFPVICGTSLTSIRLERQFLVDVMSEQTNASFF